MSAAIHPAERGCFVEASAGTGKTWTMVNQIAAAIEEGVRVDRIVAVTFTHAAAGSMKVRVRQELERRNSRCEALRTLDRAFIGTIHSFCAHLMRQRPVEAEVDPDFTELDEPNARALFNSVFDRWFAGKLETMSPVLKRALVRLSYSDDPMSQLRNAAWNLADWRDHDAPWRIEPVDWRNETGQAFKRVVVLSNILDTCREWNLLQVRLAPVGEVKRRLEMAKAAGVGTQDEAENDLLSLLHDVKYIDEVKGAGYFSDQHSEEEVLDAWADLKQQLEKFRETANADLAARLRPELWEVVGEYQKAKRTLGALDFQDLLIGARDLLHHPDARRDLQARYDRVFIDEFQDTDPLQTEILLGLCGDDDAQRSGRLFVVGDPKQSIYRFRRADAREYRAVRERLTGAGGMPERKLTVCRRSTDAIHRFVNEAFASMPDALDLDGGAPAPESRPSVMALPIPRLHGSRNVSGKAAAECAPDATGAFVQWLLAESKWTVRREGLDEPQPVRPEDICILFRNAKANATTDLTQEYVRALETRRIPHVLVGSKSFHKREEIGTIRAALHAVEWPDDELSVYAVLRGGLFFIPDDDLFGFRRAHGRFTPFFEAPKDLDPSFRPVAEVLELLRKLHRRRNKVPPAEIIRKLLDAARAHIGLAFHTGGERRLANVYRLCDLARAWEASRPGSFRSFVEYLDREHEAGEQSEAAVLEQGTGGVQLMTVHKAKGLEFPVVILAHMTTHAVRQDGCERYVDSANRLCAQKLCGWAPWELRDNTEDENAEDLAESVRIGYVAATRAKDLLVVSASGLGPWKDSWLTPVYAALYPPNDRWSLPEPYPHLAVGNPVSVIFPKEVRPTPTVRPGMHTTHGGNRVFWFDPAMLPQRPGHVPGLERGELLDGTPAQRKAGADAWNAWREERDALLQRGRIASERQVRAGGAKHTAELDSIPLEVVEVPWTGQRPASNLRTGRIVHKLLDAWDEASLERRAAALGVREAASVEEIETAVQTARRAMHHASLAPVATAKQVLREYPVTVRLDSGELIEGTLDLAWTDGESWTVVDYKTGTEQPQYRTQVRLYAFALQRVTGLPARAILLAL